MNLLNSSSGNKRRELGFLILYAAAFYAFIIHRSLQLSRDHYLKLFGLRRGWLLPHRLNDVSDAQWRNFQGNLPVLTIVFTLFTLIANLSRTSFHLKTRGMSIIWILISFTYLSYLHGACSLTFVVSASIIFILSIASVNFLLVKVLIFMWLKFFLIWRYFRFWSLICGIEVPENMPRCINNCYNLETFWKNWHASYNKWLVRYLYIPLGGTRRKLLNVWVVFTFVAIWHDLEWKLLSWAWLTCLFFIPEMILKSAVNAFQVESTHGEFVVRELSAVAGAITITCLMVANLVGFVIGPSGISWLISQFLNREGLPVLAGMLLTFYVGTKLMFHIRDAKQSSS